MLKACYLLTIIGTAILTEAKLEREMREVSEDDDSTADSHQGGCKANQVCQELLLMLQCLTETLIDNSFLTRLECTPMSWLPNVCCPVRSKTNQTGDSHPITHQNNTFLDEYPKLLSPPVCGQPKLFRLLTPGVSYPDKGAWPWMAGLYSPFETHKTVAIFRCAGSIISNKHIITSAHCINTSEWRLVIVLLGLNDMRDKEDAVFFRIKKILVHPEASEHHNNIAIVYLDGTIQFTDMITPICLPKKGVIDKRKYDHISSTVAGWDRDENRVFSAKLSGFTAPIVPNAKCNFAYYKYNRSITGREMCAELDDGEKYCMGETGGPLMIPQSSTFYLIGIVSYRYDPCRNSGVPGVYVNVESYIDWIYDNI